MRCHGAQLAIQSSPSTWGRRPSAPGRMARIEGRGVWRRFVAVKADVMYQLLPPQTDLVLKWSRVADSFLIFSFTMHR